MASAYLVDKVGVRVNVGDEVTSLRGSKAIVTGWPQDGWNRVWVRFVEDGAEGEYFPQVFDLRMVKP